MTFEYIHSNKTANRILMATCVGHIKNFLSTMGAVLWNSLKVLIYSILKLQTI